MINCLCRKENMSVSEFLNLRDDVILNRSEFIANRMKNNILEKITVFTLAIAMSISKISASGIAGGISAISILTLIQTYGAWIITIIGVIEIIKIGVTEKENRSKKITIAVAKYSIANIALYVIPIGFEFFANLF